MRLLHQFGLHVGPRPAHCVPCLSRARQRLSNTIARSGVRHSSYRANKEWQRREVKDLIRRVRIARGENPDWMPKSGDWPRPHSEHRRVVRNCGNCILEVEQKGMQAGIGVRLTEYAYRFARESRGN